MDVGISFTDDLPKDQKKTNDQSDWIISVGNIPI